MKGLIAGYNSRACYDEGKRLAETLMYSYASQEGIDVRVARIFNTYGTRMNLKDGRVISNFITQALNGDPITVNQVDVCNKYLAVKVWMFF